MKKIPIISVSQQNRTSNETGKVDTTQISQSDRIGQDSTIIIFIERERDKDLFKLSLVKSRDSVNDKVLTYKVDLNRGIFMYIPESEEDVKNIQYAEKSDYENYDTGRDVF